MKRIPFPGDAPIVSAQWKFVVQLRMMLTIALIVLAVGVQGAEQDPPMLRMSFERDAVVVDGATPGGQVAWVRVTRRTKASLTTVNHETDLTICDGAGRGRFAVDGGVPTASIWVAVDVASGAFAAGGPGEGRTVLESNPFLNDLRPGVGNIDRLETTRLNMEVAVIRPKGGVWHMNARRGGDSDVDRGNPGKAIHPLNKMTPLISGTDSIDSLRPQDIVVAIDSFRMTYFVTRALPRVQ